LRGGVAGLILAGAVALPQAAANIGVPDSARGNYMGSGRACYGMLTITARHIAWITPFSECRSSPYAILNAHDGTTGLRITYELTRPSEKCRYRVLVLTHAALSENGIGWNVVGYPSLDSAVRGRSADALGCYLYR
jgi:hypothetical protein